MKLLVPLAAVLFFSPFALAVPTEIASGDILAGSPATVAVGLEPVSTFYFDAPAAGTVITTVTTDRSGIGYDIDFYFYDAGGDYISACDSVGAEESCAVPAGAAVVEVSAWYGVDLHVSVLAG